jgi:AcrR family transcriptional regulator
MGDAEETRKKILVAAKEEFLENGFEKASMRSICKKADVTTGAAYFLFKDKDDLFCQIVSPTAENIIDLLKSNEERQKVVRDNASIEKNEAVAFNVKMSEKFIRYLYSEFDLSVLLFTKAEGSSMQDFPDRIIAAFEEWDTPLIIDSVHENNPDIYFDEKTLHYLVSAHVSAILEPIKHKIPEDDALDQAGTIIRFFYAGWNELMKMKPE